MTALADRPTHTEARHRLDRRPCEPRDLPFLRELFAQARDGLLLLTPDTRDVVLDTRFRAHRRRLRLEHPRADHELLLLDGVPVGRLVVDTVETVPGVAEVRIVDLAVDAEHRGQGIGTAALAAVLAQADAAGNGTRLLAWADEVGTRRFYLRHGFTAVRADGGLVHVRPATATPRNSAPTAVNQAS